MQKSMIKKSFEFDDKTRIILDKKMALSLFRILLNQNQISKKEFEKINSELCRNININ